MGLWGELLDLVLPERCAGCAAERGLLCAGCRRMLDEPARRCRPSPGPPGLPPAWAGPAYAGAVRSVIVAYKESGRTGLCRPLGAVLARSVVAATAASAATAATATTAATAATAASVTGPVLLVPAPSARSAVRRRGHDPIREVALAAAAGLTGQGLSARCVPALAQSRRVADQAGLSAPDRARNLQGALVVTRPGSVRGHEVVVVDDVITTGATLAEAARALRAAGASVRGAAVIAATRRRSHT